VLKVFPNQSVFDLPKADVTRATVCIKQSCNKLHNFSNVVLHGYCAYFLVEIIMDKIKPADSLYLYIYLQGSMRLPRALALRPAFMLYQCASPW